MDQKQMEDTIASTEKKIEILEEKRRDLQLQVEKQRVAVELLKRLVQNTEDLDAHIK